MPRSEFDKVLAELAGADEEHGSVALEHESGRNLSYSIGGSLLLEKVDSDDPADRFHQHHVSREYVKSLWLKLSAGEVQDVLREPWGPGYG